MQRAEKCVLHRGVRLVADVESEQRGMVSELRNHVLGALVIVFPRGLAGIDVIRIRRAAVIDDQLDPIFFTPIEQLMDALDLLRLVGLKTRSLGDGDAGIGPFLDRLLVHGVKVVFDPQKIVIPEADRIAVGAESLGLVHNRLHILRNLRWSLRAGAIANQNQQIQQSGQSHHICLHSLRV